MGSKKKCKLKRCKHCNNVLDRIWFTSTMTEEWSWNGEAWECSARHSLITDPQEPVRCPECDTVVGTGLDFGFRKSHK